MIVYMICMYVCVYVYVCVAVCVYVHPSNRSCICVSIRLCVYVDVIDARVGRCMYSSDS